MSSLDHLLPKMMGLVGLTFVAAIGSCAFITERGRSDGLLDCDGDCRKGEVAVQFVYNPPEGPPYHIYYDVHGRAVRHTRNEKMAAYWRAKTLAREKLHESDGRDR